MTGEGSQKPPKRGAWEDFHAQPRLLLEQCWLSDFVKPPLGAKGNILQPDSLASSHLGGWGPQGFVSL